MCFDVLFFDEVGTKKCIVMNSQFGYFLKDCQRAVNSRYLSLILFIFTRPFLAILIYRIEHGLYLIFGKVYTFARVLFYPLLKFLEIITNTEIHYKASIGPGFKILHAPNGIIISRYAKIGKNFTMTGGNIIGIKNDNAVGNDISIGDNCTLGGNAVIIGPLTLGNDITIGAMALVNKNFDSGAILTGVPARDIKIRKGFIPVG